MVEAVYFSSSMYLNSAQLRVTKYVEILPLHCTEETIYKYTENELSIYLRSYSSLIVSPLPVSVGADGRVGATGPRGGQGPPGQIQVMDTLIGPDGAQGLPGPQGVDGPTGPSGQDGQKGEYILFLVVFKIEKSLSFLLQR